MCSYNLLFCRNVSKKVPEVMIDPRRATPSKQLKKYDVDIHFPVILWNKPFSNGTPFDSPLSFLYYKAHYTLCFKTMWEVSKYYNKWNIIFPLPKPRLQKISLLKSKLNIELKKKLIRCYVWSIDLYGSETWKLRILESKFLTNFEMWCWRRT